MRHMSHDCDWAEEIRYLSLVEWHARSGNPASAEFEAALFPGYKEGAMAEALRTLNDICTYHIWTDRCKWKHEDAVAVPPAVVANTIWTEFESALKARIVYLDTKETWWTFRANAELVSTDTADQKIEDIRREATLLATLIPIWMLPKHRFLTAERITEVISSRRAEGEDFLLLAHPPNTYPIWGCSWRLRTFPQRDGGGTLDTEALLVDNTGVTSKSSSSGSAD
jgi:hypothetical protein